MGSKISVGDGSSVGISVGSILEFSGFATREGGREAREGRWGGKGGREGRRGKNFHTAKRENGFLGFLGFLVFSVFSVFSVLPSHRAGHDAGFVFLGRVPP